MLLGAHNLNLSIRSLLCKRDCKGFVKRFVDMEIEIETRLGICSKYSFYMRSKRVIFRIVTIPLQKISVSEISFLFLNFFDIRDRPRPLLTLYLYLLTIVNFYECILRKLYPPPQKEKKAAWNIGDSRVLRQFIWRY